MGCSQQVGSLLLAGSMLNSLTHSFNYMKRYDPPKCKNKSSQSCVILNNDLHHLI